MSTQQPSRIKRAPVKDNPSLERDLDTNAILNRDRGAYLKRRQRRSVMRAKDERIASLECQVAELLLAVKKLLPSDK